MGVLFLFQLLGILFAQEPTLHTDTLYVINSISKKPLYDVKFTSETGVVFSTNIDGYIILNNVMDAHLPLIIEKENYHSTTLKKNNCKSIIELKPIIFLGDEVKITEEAFQSELSVPLKTYQVNSAQIEYSTSAQSLIEPLPSITLKSYGGRAGVSTVSIHGGQSQRFSVMFDGVSINNEQNGGADISQIPTFLLSNIEYLSQGHSSRFGTSAMTGILNLSPSKQGTKVSISLGNFNERSIGALFTKSLQKTSFTLGLGQSNYDAHYSYKELGGYSKVPYQLNSIFTGLQNAIQQDFLYSYLHQYFKNAEFTLTYFDVYNFRNLSTNVYTSPINVLRMCDGLKIFSSSLKLPNLKISHSRKQTTIEYLDDKHSLITNNLSFSLIHGPVTSTINAINVFSQSSRLLDMSKTYYTGSLYYRSSWNHIDISTSLKTGAEENSKPVFSYDLIIKNNISQRLNSSFTFSHNYKKPNFNDLFWEPFGDPNLETEYSDNFYVKNQLFTKYGELNIDAHYISFDNLISWRPMVGSNAYWIPENISSAKSYGADLTYKSNPFKNSTFSASYSLSITKNYNQSLSHPQQGKPLLYSPTHSGSISIQSQVNNSTFKISTKFIDEKIYTYGSMLPSYFTANLSYKYKFTNKNKFDSYIHLKSENIFDIQYQSVHGFPVPGRSYSITITIKETK